MDSVRIDPLFDPFDPQRVSGVTVTFEPGARVAIQEKLDGKAVEWLEKVTDGEYEAGSRTRTQGR